MKINFESLEPISSNKVGSVKYDRENQAMFLEGEGVPTLELIKGLLDPVITYAEKNKIVCAVLDLSKAKGTFTSANSYIKNEFAPPMIKMGYRCAGLVTSNDPFTKFAVNAMISLVTPKGLEIKMFNSIKSCEEWLTEKLK
jgi:hypothetical protein